MCAHKNCIQYMCLTVNVCVNLGTYSTSIYCICLLLVKGHELNYSDCQNEDTVWVVTVHRSLKWQRGRKEMVPPKWTLTA